MKISRKKIKSLKPCQDGLEWYIKNGSDDLLETLIKVDKFKPDWARWLFTRLMNKKQNIEIAIFSVQKVLPLYENKYPNDLAPRTAIKAALLVLDGDTKKNRRAATYAYAAASAAAYAYAAASASSYAAASAAAASQAAATASSAATSYAAISAATYASHAVTHAADSLIDGLASSDQLRLAIIEQAVKILNRTKKGK